MIKFKIDKTEKKYSVDGKVHYSILYLAGYNEFGEMWRRATEKTFETKTEAEAILKMLKRKVKNV